MICQKCGEAEATHKGALDENVFVNAGPRPVYHLCTPCTHLAREHWYVMERLNSGESIEELQARLKESVFRIHSTFDTIAAALESARHQAHVLMDRIEDLKGKEVALARLDTDGTAEPLTRIVHHVPKDGHWHGPGSKMINPEYVTKDDVRIPLAAERVKK